MKKIIAILAIVTFAACGGEEKPTPVPITRQLLVPTQQVLLCK
jgi:hypothetical protein